MKRPSRNNGQGPTNYGFLYAIEQAFQSPYRLLKNRFLSRRKKEEILEEWQEGRQKMLYEQGRDRDYEKGRRDPGDRQNAQDRAGSG